MRTSWTSIPLAIVHLLENKLDDLCAASVSNRLLGTVTVTLTHQNLAKSCTAPFSQVTLFLFANLTEQRTLAREGEETCTLRWMRTGVTMGLWGADPFLLWITAIHRSDVAAEWWCLCSEGATIRLSCWGRDVWIIPWPESMDYQNNPETWTIIKQQITM